MISVRKAAVGILIAVLAAGCGRGIETSPRAGIDPAPAVAAPADVRESLHPVPASEVPEGGDGIGLRPADRAYLAVSKSSLDKEFLFSATLIGQQTAPTGTGMQGRIVALKRHGDSVFLMEATQGHVVTEDLPSQMILAEIPVIRETGDSLILDYNSGMDRAFTLRNWHGSEGKDTDYDASSVVRSAKVGHSFLDSIRTVDNILEIRQIAQIEMDDSTPTYEIRYFLTPYRPDPTFEPMESTDFKLAGFFEVPPFLEETTGRSIVRVSKWNEKKPIVYHVSANTPPEFVGAVKQGILYWNKAFGREAVRAEVAPEGVTAPDPRYNLIQWVPWDTAGFAYADALMDPRSGEILHAQAYLTSVFGVAPQKRVRALLRRFRHLRERAEEAAGEGHSRLGLRFLDSARLCGHHAQQVEMLRSAESTLAKILDAGLSDDKAAEAGLRVARDYVRFVSAHEVGHTLGLRHNFAGTLGGTVDPLEKIEAVSDYIVEGTVPDPREGVLTSSVMDYLHFEDDVFVGSQFALLDTALEYDLQAIKRVYEGREMTRGASPLFCTDSMVGTYADCNRYDMGSDPLIGSAALTATRLKYAPASVVEKFLSAKAPNDPRDRQPLEEVEVDPDSLATVIAAEMKNMLRWFKEDTRSVRIERSFPFVGTLNEEDVLAARYAWVDSQVSEAGGLKALLFGLLPDSERSSPGVAEAGIAALNAYLDRPDVRNFTGGDGERHTLSETEVAHIREQGRLYFETLEEKLLTMQLKVLATAKFEEPATRLDAESALGGTMSEIILARGDEEIEGPEGEDGEAVMKKDFRYSVEDRILAGRLLKPNLGSLNDWSYMTRREVKADLTEALEEIMGSELSKVKLHELSRHKRNWFMDQKKVLGAL